MRSTAYFALILLVSIGIAGCGAERKPNSVETPSSVQIGVDDAANSSAGFYPLTLGNRWSFQRRLVAVYNVPGQSPITLADVTAPVETELVCVEALGGMSYVVERSTETSGGSTVQDWVRMRQDRSGLYEADVSSQTAPACQTAALTASSASRRNSAKLIAAGLARAASSPAELSALSRAWEGVEAQLAAVRGAVGPRAGFAVDPTALAAGEITRLSYPMHKGQSWVIRESPQYAAVVERSEKLETPAGNISAYRVRISSELFAPGSSVLMWESRQGFVGLNSHIEFVVLDASNNPIGTIVTDDVLTLTGLNLAKGGK